jgi:hypothetical protein
MYQCEFLMLFRQPLTHPDIEAFVDEDERKTSLLLCKTNPDLTVHQKAMVHVYHSLFDAVGSGIDLLFLLSLAPR